MGMFTNWMTVMVYNKFSFIFMYQFKTRYYVIVHKSLTRTTQYVNAWIRCNWHTFDASFEMSISILMFLIKRLIV